MAVGDPYSRSRSLLCLCFVLERPQSSLPDVPLGPAGRCGDPGTDAWRPLIQEAIPSYGHKLSEEPELLAQVRKDTMETLELDG